MQSLAGGFLTAKYRKGQPLPKSKRVSGAKEKMTDQGFAVIAALDAVAGAHESSQAAVALARLLSRPTISSLIIGCELPQAAAGSRFRTRDGARSRRTCRAGYGQCGHVRPESSSPGFPLDFPDQSLQKIPRPT